MSAPITPAEARQLVATLARHHQAHEHPTCPLCAAYNEAGRWLIHNEPSRLHRPADAARQILAEAARPDPPGSHR